MKYKKLKDKEAIKLIEEILNTESPTRNKDMDFVIWGLGPNAMREFDKAVKAWINKI